MTASHRKHDLEWFQFHDKKANTLGTTCETHTIRTRTFHLRDRVQTFQKAIAPKDLAEWLTRAEKDGKTRSLADWVRTFEDSGWAKSYRIIYGYCQNGDTLQARMWYFSRSEAAWRSFTGFRKGGAWMKGGEGMPGHIGSGYIFENIVCKELEPVLETFWEADTPISSETQFPWRRRNSENSHLLDFYYDRYGRDEHHRRLGPPGDITRAYAGERVYIEVETPAIDEDIKKAMKKGSTTLQRGYTSTYDKGRGKNVRQGIGHRIKHTNNIWDGWILDCLESNPFEKETRHHPVLDLDYKIRRYHVGGIGTNEDFTIEIACTDSPVDHDYGSAYGFKSIETNICWIRTVYLENTDITSFGTHKTCPINLAILPQKPFDYISQTSDFYANKVGVKYRTGSKKSIAVKNSKGTYANKYILLSLFNEALSPLIKEFKRKKGMPFFEGKYNVIQKMYEDGTEGAGFIKRLLNAGIDEYLDIHDTKLIKGKSKKGHHGSKGVTRAKELKKEINRKTTTRDMSGVLYDCFKRNRVGSFSGGTFSRIRTKPSSLFTCVCRSLLGPFTSCSAKGRRSLNGKQNAVACLLDEAAAIDFFRVTDSKKQTDPPSETEIITANSSRFLKRLKSL